MAIKEFYIRNADETDARGPFTIEQLCSLAETGGVSVDTLYYEPNSEQWVVIKDDAEVKALVFPEKKKLSLKKDATVAKLNKDEESKGPIEVNDMLAAAEGRTHDTKDKAEHLVMADRCAKLGLWGAIAMLILSAAAEILPSIEVLTHFEAAKLLAAPLVLLGVIDVVLSVLLILGVSAIYPFVRFRAMLGLGFMGFLFYAQGQSALLAAALAGSVGLYISTVFLSYFPIFLSLVLGIGGSGALVYLLVFRN